MARGANTTIHPLASSYPSWQNRLAEWAEIAVTSQLPALTTTGYTRGPASLARWIHRIIDSASNLPPPSPHLRESHAFVLLARHALLSHPPDSSLRTSTAHRPPNIYLHGTSIIHAFPKIAALDTDVILHWSLVPSYYPSGYRGTANLSVGIHTEDLDTIRGCLGKARRPLTYSRKSFVQS
jgi:hypothetical protein